MQCKIVLVSIHLKCLVQKQSDELTCKEFMSVQYKYLSAKSLTEKGAPEGNQRKNENFVVLIELD